MNVGGRNLILTFGLAAGLVAMAPSPAQADVVTVWGAVKGAATGGTSDLFINYQGNIAGGVEAGIELFGIDLFGEALLLDTDQYFFTLNLGSDLRFGETLRLDVGAFTGPMFFLFPKDPAAQPQGIQTDALTPDEQQLLLLGAQAAGYSTLDELNQEFASQTMGSEDLNRLAVGWNLVRARAAVELAILKFFSIGVVGHFGYHVLIKGEEIAAGAKNRAIDEFAAANPSLPPDAIQILRRSVGARPVDTDKLNGFNYNIGAFAKIEF